MKNLNKILFIITTLCFLIPSFSSANDTDCKIFGGQSYKGNSNTNSFVKVDQIRGTNTLYTSFLTPEQKEAIITKDDLNTALLNLKKYCCNNELGGLKQNYSSCTDDSTLFNKNSLDSPYLFDHLMDVIMRRLNGLSGENYIYTESKMTLDDKGAARRSWIINQAMSDDGSIPQTILDEYKKFRTASSPDLGYYIADKMQKVFSREGNNREGNLNYLNYVNGNEGNNESQSIAKALQNYNNRTLYDRYKNACALGEYFYALLLGSSKSDDKDKISASISDCNNMIDKQISGESEYVTRVAKDASNKFLYNYINGYMDYLNNRQVNFKEVWTNSTDKWLDVIRGVPCLQRKCTK